MKLISVCSVDLFSSRVFGGDRHGALRIDGFKRALDTPRQPGDGRWAPRWKCLETSPGVSQAPRRDESLRGIGSSRVQSYDAAAAQQSLKTSLSLLLPFICPSLAPLRDLRISLFFPPANIHHVKSIVIMTDGRTDNYLTYMTLSN